MGELKIIKLLRGLNLPVNAVPREPHIRTQFTRSGHLAVVHEKTLSQLDVSAYLLFENGDFVKPESLNEKALYEDEKVGKESEEVVIKSGEKKVKASELREVEEDESTEATVDERFEKDSKKPAKQTKKKKKAGRKSNKRG